MVRGAKCRKQRRHDPGKLRPAAGGGEATRHAVSSGSGTDGNREWKGKGCQKMMLQ